MLRPHVRLPPGSGWMGARGGLPFKVLRVFPNPRPPRKKNSLTRLSVGQIRRSHGLQDPGAWAGAGHREGGEAVARGGEAVRVKEGMGVDPEDPPVPLVRYPTCEGEGAGGVLGFGGPLDIAQCKSGENPRGCRDPIRPPPVLWGGRVFRSSARRLVSRRFPRGTYHPPICREPGGGDGAGGVQTCRWHPCRRGAFGWAQTEDTQIPYQSP